MSHDSPSRELFHIIEPPRECSYLPAETASLEYRGLSALSPEELEARISRGWRRFGIQLFRPVCESCTQCESLRVDVNAFQSSKSQRKCRRRNADVEVEFGVPEFSRAHVDLYNAWHQDMSARSQWPLQQSDPRSYADAFLLGEFPSLHELRYFRNGELAGVGLIEVLPRSLSSIYYYHDPEWRDLGPGTFSILCELDLARQLGKQHLYLGYWIQACPSMSYKNRFHPHELLMGRPGLNEEPVWARPGPNETVTS